MFLFFFLIYLLLLFNFSFSYFKLHWFHPVILFVKLICTGHIVLSLGQSLLYCITPSSPLCMLSRVSRSTTPQCPLRLLCPWDSPGKNTQVGCHALLQGIFPTQGLNPCLYISCIGKWVLYQLGMKGAIYWALLRSWDNSSVFISYTQSCYLQCHVNYLTQGRVDLSCFC